MAKYMIWGNTRDEVTEPGEAVDELATLEGAWDGQTPVYLWTVYDGRSVGVVATGPVTEKMIHEAVTELLIGHSEVRTDAMTV